MTDAERTINGHRVRNYDWPSIKARYVEGIPARADAPELGRVWPTMNEAAEHFGVQPSRVRERAAAEGWREARARYQADTERVRQQARAAALSREATQLDERALNGAKLGLQLCIARLTEIGQAAQAARSAANAGGGSGAAIDAQEQQRLAQAVDLWHKIGLRAVGDPETHRIELSGPNGQPLEVAHELRRDDPQRLTGVLSVLQQAGLGELFAAGVPTIDGEVVP